MGRPQNKIPTAPLMTDRQTYRRMHVSGAGRRQRGYKGHELRGTLPDNVTITSHVGVPSRVASRHVRCACGAAQRRVY